MKERVIQVSLEGLPQIANMALVGHLACRSPFLEAFDWTWGCSTGSTQPMQASGASAVAPFTPLAVPDEGRGMRIPSACHGFQTVNNDLYVVWMTPVQGSSLENSLN